MLNPGTGLVLARIAVAKVPDPDPVRVAFRPDPSFNGDRGAIGNKVIGESDVAAQTIQVNRAVAHTRAARQNSVLAADGIAGVGGKAVAVGQGGRGEAERQGKGSCGP